MHLELALGVLTRHQVDFVVVGGVAVAAHGSSLMTEDLDVLYRVEDENIRRLVTALEELDAHAYADPRKLRFGFNHLNNHGHHLCETRAGRLDVLGSIGIDGNIRYEDVVDDAVRIDAFATTFLCISLDRLIQVKRELGRPRDQIAVMELEAIKKLEAPS